MTTEWFVKLALSIVSVLGIIITAYVVPAVKNHVTAEKMEQLTYYVSVAIRCAEQIYTPDEWKSKKQWVTEYVKGVINNKLHIDLTDADIDTIIEGVVNEIKHDSKYQAVERK